MQSTLQATTLQQPKLSHCSSHMHSPLVHQARFRYRNYVNRNQMFARELNRQCEDCLTLFQLLFGVLCDLTHPIVVNFCCIMSGVMAESNWFLVMRSICE